MNIFWPGFFDPFKFWYLVDNIPLAVIQIAPLFVYALILALVSTKDIQKIKAKEVVLLRSIYLSVMAGILEEIGYRCIFIFAAMIPIAIIDFLLFGIATWINQVIIFPIVNLLTLGLMAGTIYGLPPLLIAGAIDANLTFRDGHKYQSAFGYINSWFVGMYLLFIMFTQGLLIAIFVHMIYDLIFDFVRYGARSLKD